MIMDLVLFLSFVGQIDVFDGKVETNSVASFVFTVFVGLLGVPGLLSHCVFGCSLIVDVQQLVYVNRMALSNVRVPHLPDVHDGDSY